MTYYNNPTLCPQIPPFNQIKLDNNGHQLLNESSSFTYQQLKLPNHSSPNIPENDIKNLPGNLYETRSASVHHPHDSTNISDDNGMVEHIMYDQMYMEQVSNGSEAELGNYYKTIVNGDNFVTQEDHPMLDFECFTGMLDDTGSWDSSAPTAPNMFQDYELGYNNNVSN